MKIAGIVNGTTNFILTKMRDEGLSYEDALKQAQANGYAEQNPTADVEGIDAQRKLSILSSIALGGKYVAPDVIHTEGISGLTLDDIKFAESIGASVKLIAFFSHPEGGVPAAFVAPHVVAKSSLIASVDGVFNAILVEGNALGESMFYGQGAGKLATASAVVADVLDAGLHAHKNAHITKWYIDDSKVTLDYEDVVVSILVKGDANSVVAAFDSYETVKISDNAVVVKNIAHKDIDSKISAVAGASWLHYLA